MESPIDHKPWIVVFGPTGSGKSGLAVYLAQAIDGFLKEQQGRRCHIISCDSVAVYKGFDIGSAKPSREQRQQVPHHLVDVVDWDGDFDAERYRQAAQKAMEAIWMDRGIPIVVGGTGLYLRALQGDRFDFAVPKNPELRAHLQGLSLGELLEQLRALNPERAQSLHPNDRVRLMRAIEIATVSQQRSLEASGPTTAAASFPEPMWTVSLDPPRATLHQRIAERTATMLREGLVEEVRELLRNGVDPHCKPMESIGYRQTCEVLAGSLNQELLAEKIAAASRQYAKRQCTWFKKLPRDHTLPSGEFPLDGMVLEKLFSLIVAELSL